MVFKCAVSMNTVRFVAAILVVFALASAVPVPHKDKSHGSDESAELAALENSASVNGSAEADIETDGISATNLGRIARSEDSETHVHVDGESDEEDHNDDDEDEDETAEDGDNVDLVKREVDDEDEDEDDDADLDDDDDDDADSDDDDAAVVKREADSNSSENDSEDAAVEEPAASGPGAAAIVEDSPPAYKKKRDTSTSQVVLDKLASLVETVKNDPEFQQIHQAVSASDVPQAAVPASA